MPEKVGWLVNPPTQHTTTRHTTVLHDTLLHDTLLVHDTLPLHVHHDDTLVLVLHTSARHTPTRLRHTPTTLSPHMPEKVGWLVGPVNYFRYAGKSLITS